AGGAVLDMGVLAQSGTPRELYNRPASRFVADFLGETNFLSAQVTEQQADTVHLHATAGDLASTAFDRDSRLKGNVTCSVRPEAIRLVEPKGDSLAGEVVESIYLGEMAQHIVRLQDDSRLKVFELHPMTPVANGTRVGLEIAPSDVVVLAD
ncbi:MAG: TOBE domain-containing protein, partial [Planctomycetota bacterium]